MSSERKRRGLVAVIAGVGAFLAAAAHFVDDVGKGALNFLKGEKAAISAEAKASRLLPKFTVPAEAPAASPQVRSLFNPRFASGLRETLPRRAAQLVQRIDAARPSTETQRMAVYVLRGRLIEHQRQVAAAKAAGDETQLQRLEAQTVELERQVDRFERDYG